MLSSQAPGVHVSGVPVHSPAWHVSFSVQTEKSSQGVPSGASVSGKHSSVSGFRHIDGWQSVASQIE